MWCRLQRAPVLRNLLTNQGHHYHNTIPDTGEADAGGRGNSISCSKYHGSGGGLDHFGVLDQTVSCDIFLRVACADSLERNVIRK